MLIFWFNVLPDQQIWAALWAPCFKEFLLHEAWRFVSYQSIGSNGRLHSFWMDSIRWKFAELGPFCWKFAELVHFCQLTAVLATSSPVGICMVLDLIETAKKSSSSSFFNLVWPLMAIRIDWSIHWILTGSSALFDAVNWIQCIARFFVAGAGLVGLELIDWHWITWQHSGSFLLELADRFGLHFAKWILSPRLNVSSFS